VEWLKLKALSSKKKKKGHPLSKRAETRSYAYKGSRKDRKMLSRYLFESI
jgi:hypothetical protein